jgi:hypothetical protein
MPRVSQFSAMMNGTVQNGPICRPCMDVGEPGKLEAWNQGERRTFSREPFSLFPLRILTPASHRQPIPKCNKYFVSQQGWPRLRTTQLFGERNDPCELYS